VTEAMKVASNRVNVFEICLTLHCRSEESAAATTPCRLQLCSLLAQLAGYVVTTVDFFSTSWRMDARTNCPGCNI